MYLNDHANSNLAIMGGRVGMIGGAALGSNNYNQFVPLNSLTPGSNSSSSAASSSQQLTHLNYNHHNHHHHHHNHQQHHHHNNTNFFNQNYGANLP